MKKSVVILGICILVPIIVIMSAIGLLLYDENIFTKWELNNPYINRAYSNWEYVTIGTDFFFAIPCEWTVQEDNGVYSIYDGTGRLWADGALFRSESAQFETICDFVSAVTSVSDISIEIDPYSSVYAMEGADIDKMYVRGSGFATEYYCLQLTKAMGEEILFILYCDISTNEEDYDIVEAIMYSFAWGYKETLLQPGTGRRFA